MMRRLAAIAPRRFAGGRVALLVALVGAWAMLTPSLPGAATSASADAPRVLLLDAAHAGEDIVTVGERGAILHTTDSARTWTTRSSPATATLTGIAFAPGGGTGWAVGHDAIIIVTTDGGRTWARQYQGENLQDSFLDVVAIDAQRVIAVGAYGLFVATSDGGKTWTRRKLGDDDFHYNRITRGPTGTLYLAGESGTLLRSADNGDNWSAIATPYEGSFYGILPLDAQTLLAYGLRGHVYRSINDGTTWEQIPTPQPVLLATAVRLKGDVIVLAGQARALLVSTDGGKTFTAPPAAPPTALAELIALPNGNLLGLGEAGVTVLPSAPLIGGGSR